MMPSFIQSIAPLLPAYHLDQLALSVVGLGQGGVLVHVLVLVGFTAAFLLLAARRLRRYG
jgi:ABC-2 type transport system permease protein